LRARVCMVVYSYYPKDVRVRREAEALAKHGYDVTVICLREAHEKRNEVVNGVKVFRLPMQTAREGKKLRYIYQYSMFFLLAFWALSVMHMRHRYRIVHTHSLPDFIVFTAILPKLTGAKVILDLHEAMPEIYLAKMHAKPGGALHRTMLFLENISANFADAVITVSDYIKKIFVSRGMEERKITVIWNVPDINEFVEPTWKDNKKIVFAGKLIEYQDFDTVLEGMCGLEGVELHVYGDGILLPHIKKKVEDLKLGEKVFLHGWVSQKVVHEKLLEHAIVILPFVDNEITRLAVGNKVLEATVLGRPIVAPELPALQELFGDALYYYKPGSPASFVQAIERVFKEREKACICVRKAQERMKERKISWLENEKKLLALYNPANT
jgi:glycosyltransferase involved in cell wall biosynthesis